MDDLPDLGVADEFVAATYLKDQGHAYRNIGKLHCPTCGDYRRMDMAVRLKPYGSSADPPMLVLLTCVQCDTLFTAVIYEGPEGRSLALLPSTYGGLTTVQPEHKASCQRFSAQIR